jgi:hypothetical protein
VHSADGGVFQTEAVIDCDIALWDTERVIQDSRGAWLCPQCQRRGLGDGLLLLGADSPGDRRAPPHLRQTLMHMHRQFTTLVTAMTKRAKAMTIMAALTTSRPLRMLDNKGKNSSLF